LFLMNEESALKKQMRYILTLGSIVLLGIFTPDVNANERISQIQDPAALHRIALDPNRDLADRDFAVSKLGNEGRHETDRAKKAAWHYYYARALLEVQLHSKSHERREHKEAERYLRRALETGSADAAGYMAKRIDASKSDRAKAEALVLWVKAYHYGSKNALERVERLLPDKMSFLNKHVKSDKDRWLTLEVGSHTKRSYWKTKYAYYALVEKSLDGRKPSKAERTHALTAIEQAVAANDDEARHTLALYLYNDRIDRHRARDLFTTAAKNGHSGSNDALAQLKPKVPAPTRSTMSASTPKKASPPPKEAPLPAKATTPPKKEPRPSPPPNGSPQEEVTLAEALICLTIIIGLPLTLVMMILSLKGRVHIYLNNGDLALSIGIWVTVIIGLIAMPHSKPLFWGTLSLAGVLLVVTFIMGLKANAGPISASLVLIPKLFMAVIVIILGMITIGAALAVKESIKDRKAKEAVQSAAVAAAGGAAYLWLTRKFLPRLMPSQEAEPNVQTE
jgi:hypothetical protein